MEGMEPTSQSEHNLQTACCTVILLICGSQGGYGGWEGSWRRGRAGDWGAQGSRSLAMGMKVF